MTTKKELERKSIACRVDLTVVLAMLMIVSIGFVYSTIIGYSSDNRFNALADTTAKLGCPMMQYETTEISMCLKTNWTKATEYDKNLLEKCNIKPYTLETNNAENWDCYHNLRNGTDYWTDTRFMDYELCDETVKHNFSTGFYNSTSGNITCQGGNITEKIVCNKPFNYCPVNGFCIYRSEEAEESICYNSCDTISKKLDYTFFYNGMDWQPLENCSKCIDDGYCHIEQVYEHEQSFTVEEFERMIE